MSIEQQIHKYILDSFLIEGDSIDLAIDDDLLKVLDSLQIIRTVVELERMFSIQVGTSEMTIENLGSIEKLATLIRGKTQTEIESSSRLDSELREARQNP